MPRAASGVTVIRIGATLACLQSEPPSAASAAASASGTCHDDARPRRNLNDGGNGGDNLNRRGTAHRHGGPPSVTA